MNHLTKVSSALVALAAPLSAQPQYVPYAPPFSVPQIGTRTAVVATPAVVRAKTQPIEPIDLPASIDQGIDLMYTDPDIAPDVQRRSALPDGMNLEDWSGAPIDLFTAVNPAYTELRRGLMKYSQRWGSLPQVEVAEGQALKLGSSGDRVALLRKRLGLADGTKFDAPLAKAVSEYQQAHGVKADGIAGNGTIQSLNRGAEHYQRVIILNMERALRLPTPEDRGRYILIDAGEARLYMYEDGKQVDSMRVIVGNAETQTPMMAAQLRYVSLTPYWNAPQELVRSLIAKNVLEQGLTYLTDRDYVVLSDWTDDATVVDPATVDWGAVAAGRKELRVRRGPGPWNSMGKMKFMLPNDLGIYLHDVPEPSKVAFASDDRWISNGCVRLEDAKRLEKWVFNGDVPTPSGAPEERVDLPAPVPVYMTYLTAELSGDGIAFRADPYNRDAPLLARVKLPDDLQTAAVE